ncbi:M23 family metallopeptidase [Pseudoclavibacter sp. RFBB5]|uniref:M23 family metallopeptidase n=1 Tax=Pseudoclavibacter sp. RFBB5 TaxID=2080574 RepID=UPI000CE84CF7|nr:M23 family metallopeptidase [Pseudoclavibacter sp. RFBB5]PPG29639.1 hypothetical protein C5B97_11750 [Pseudoclavibacter sp. RFBB5]
MRYEPTLEEQILTWPIDMSLASFTPGSGFGPRQRLDAPPGEFEQHLALDIGAPRGTPVYAAAAGVVDVALAEDDPRAEAGGGHQVWIRHDGLNTGYYHLLSAPLVAWGDVVDAGTLLGYVGSSGVSGGPHVCFHVTLTRGAQAIALNPRNALRDFGDRSVTGPRGIQFTHPR